MFAANELIGENWIAQPEIVKRAYMYSIIIAYNVEACADLVTPTGTTDALRHLLLL